jgi:hypothetical protein
VSARLRLAPYAGALSDDRAAVARALLGPMHPVLDSQLLGILGYDRAAADQGEELYAYPRYLIGRLSQALTAPLERDVPLPDATGQLLIEAITDAANCREDMAFACRCEEGRCLPRAFTRRP